jgi:hypothetical protein
MLRRCSGSCRRRWRCFVKCSQVRGGTWGALIAWHSVQRLTYPSLPHLRACRGAAEPPAAAAVVAAAARERDGAAGAPRSDRRRGGSGSGGKEHGAACRSLQAVCLSACAPPPSLIGALLIRNLRTPCLLACSPAAPRPQELKLLSEDANVYKMIGPVLVRQDTLEARSNVDKRLEFIGGGWVHGRLWQWPGVREGSGSSGTGWLSPCLKPRCATELPAARMPGR